VIPGDVTEAAVSQCELTMHAKADTSPEAVQRLLDAFADFGVSKEQIEARIQRRIDAIQPAQIVSLRKVFASLKDGMSVPAEWFDVEEDAKTACASRTEAVKARIAPKKPTPASYTVVDKETGEVVAPAPAEPEVDQDDEFLRGLDGA
jgi:hypothetical protein